MKFQRIPMRLAIAWGWLVWQGCGGVIAGSGVVDEAQGGPAGAMDQGGVGGDGEPMMMSGGTAGKTTAAGGVSGNGALPGNGGVGGGASGGTNGLGGNQVTAGDGGIAVVEDEPPVGYVRGAVAVGAGGIRLLSRDGGKSWVKTGEVRQGGGDDGDLLRSVTYGNKLWVAGGWNKWWTSPDGQNWTLRSHKHGIIQGLAYGNNMFIASTISGDILKSLDGLQWTPIGNAGMGSHSRVVFGNGLFAVSGDPGKTVTSADGMKWQNSPVRDPVAFCNDAFRNHNECYGTTYNAGFWVQGIWLRELGGFIQTSPDGKVWKNLYEPKTNGLDRISVGWVPSA